MNKTLPYVKVIFRDSIDDKIIEENKPKGYYRIATLTARLSHETNKNGSHKIATSWNRKVTHELRKIVRVKIEDKLSEVFVALDEINSVLPYDYRAKVKGVVYVRKVYDETLMAEQTIDEILEEFEEVKRG